MGVCRAERLSSKHKEVRSGATDIYRRIDTYRHRDTI